MLSKKTKNSQGEMYHENVGKKFRDWLDKFLTDNDLSNRDAAILFGVNDCLIAFYLRGMRLPTYTTLQRIKVATKINLNILFNDKFIDEEEE